MTAENMATNLIINYLPQFLTDEEYKNMFLSIGPIKSSKIVRDKTSGFSYGFGFVEFQTDRDAARAVRVFDGLPMYGKRIRVQHANKNDEESMAYNIYVKNIPSTYTETDLDKLFEPFGKIVTSKVLIDLQTGQSRNVGFVLFESKAEADKAISEMNGKTPAGCTNSLYVKYADDATKKASKAVQPMIPQVVTQAPAFTPPIQAGNGFPPTGQPGPVRNQPMNKNRFNPMARSNPVTPDYPVPNFNLNKNFNAPPPQNKNFFNMNPPPHSDFNNPNLDIPKGPAPYSLFVYNIGDDAEDRELWALFSPFGTVQKCTVMMDNDRRVCKGFGFVDMANALEAVNAIKSLNGFFYKGRQLNVSFKHKRQT